MVALRRKPSPRPGRGADREPADGDRAERTPADPRGYFAGAREQARSEVGRDIEREIRRLRSP
jgi:hypothetical protein